MRTHKTVQVALNGSTVSIDEEIVDLVKVINSIPGIQTLNSCQGDYFGAYVQFSGDGSKGSNTVCTRFLQIMIEAIAPQVRKHSAMEKKYVANNGWRHGTYDLYLDFQVKLYNEASISWSRNTYPFVLKAAKKAAKQLIAVKHSSR